MTDSSSNAVLSLEPRVVRGVWLWCAALTLVLGIVGCSGDTDPGEGSRFTVVDSLLGPALSDSTLGVTFRAPAVFEAARPEFMAQVASQIPRDPGNVYFVQPHMIFAIPGENARIFVSGFPEKLDNEMDAVWREGYLEQAREKAVPQVPELDEYTLNGADVLELRINSREIANVRLVCGRETRPIVQIDYLIPQSLYEELRPALESSMGSLGWF